MDAATRIAFTKGTETKVLPKDVGKLYGRAEMLAKLPKNVQQWIVEKGAGDDPYIPFVVEPYCSFLAYEIVDVDAASAQLPADYRIVPTSIFSSTDPRPTGIVAAFSVHTSVFWGIRVEYYVVAENTRTGLLSWIICDYESNTISYDPGQGFSGSSTSHATVTTTYAGELVVDVAGEASGNHLAFTADLGAATMEPLTERLWVEGNLSVDYGGRLIEEESTPFGLIFDPGEMARALRIPLDAVSLDANTFGGGTLASEPFEACCFPYAQHFVTTSYPLPTPITTREQLEAAVRDFNGRLPSPGAEATST